MRILKYLPPEIIIWWDHRTTPFMPNSILFLQLMFLHLLEDPHTMSLLCGSDLLFESIYGDSTAEEVVQ